MTRDEFYRGLVGRVVAPLAERLGLPVWTTMRRLDELQWRSGDELEERAVSRLRPLLEHAARHVPYYRAFLGGVDPRSIKAFADLARIPITAKPELRAGFPAATTAENLPTSRRQRMMTSGSTGLPFEFYWDRAMLPVLGGTDRFWLGWSKVGPWHTRVVIASPSYFYERVKPPRRLHALVNRLLVGERTENLPADQITTEGFRSLVERLTARGGYFIRSYPGALASLAARLVAEGIELAAYPRAVVALAETLTPANAARLREVFRCPVMNHYSSWEVPHIAHSCPAEPDLLHVNSERVIVRVVRADGADAAPGETGRVVVTDLSNYVMPFINYSAGDLAVAGGRCACGRGMPTLARLEGRDTEMLRTADGREVSSGALGQLLTFVVGIIPYVWEYQAVQVSPDTVVLRVVPTARFAPGFQDTLAREVERFLGPGMRVTVEPVSAIPLEPSGKRMIIKPLVAPPAAVAAR
jgi:phenylacetate-CoA ligase